MQAHRFQKYYQKFLSANEGVQHYAAHSHHYWPDVTLKATEQYWLDSARFVDDKWNYFFSEKVPHVQRLIAEILNISQPEQIVFAPNTHEFVYRLLSCFEGRKDIKVLTTDSEFHSFDRQINRMSENGQLRVDKVNTQDFATLESRLLHQIATEEYDLIFLSHVFFNSGVVLPNLNRIVQAVKNPATLIVIDGYHSFMALPIDLSEIQNRVFYISGSYKYAQGGEGGCFMYVPPNNNLRPVYTGWFASFGGLSGTDKRVNYSNDGYRFAGSTMDMTALYRLEAVLTLFKQDGVTVKLIHEHIQNLQSRFLAKLQNWNHPVLKQENILHDDFLNHGHFFAFETGNADLTAKLYHELKNKRVITDYRGTVLRFGFGLYQNDDIDFGKQ